MYNERQQCSVTHAALFILLNHICFNGLYRVNRNNYFNVSLGSKTTPTICNKENILAVSEALRGVEILCGDFEQTYTRIETNTFFFIDPPYKPLNKTSNFNSYSKYKFNDDEQIRLRDYCIKLDQSGCKWILCNSDVKTHNPEDNFFDELYTGFNIYRVTAKRNINSRADRRGEISELLITNYSY